MVIAGLAIAGVFASREWFQTDLVRNGAWWAFPATIVAFGVFEYAVFNVHLRGQPVSLSLSELPVALAIVFLSTPLALFARLILALFVIVVRRRNPWYKIVFNTAWFAVEVVLASIIFNAIVDFQDGSNTSIVAAAAIAVAAVGPVGLALVTLAMAQFVGGFGTRLVTELKATWWLYVVNSGVAAMVVALALMSPWLAVLAVFPLAGVWFVLWQYGDQVQRLRDLDAVHGFAGLVGGTLDLDEIGDVAVAEIERLLRAHGAALVRFDVKLAGHAVTHLAGDVPLALPQHATDPVWAPLLAPRQARLFSAEEFRAAGVFESLPGSAIVAPVHDSTEIVAGSLGVLVVIERPEQSNRFHQGDVARVDHLAAQLATSLRRGLLHEQLEFEARHDALTGLPNRTLFERVVAEAVAGYDARTTVCVMMLDLDRFKEVNDTLGHHAGDQVLVTFAQRIGTLLRHGDVLSRLAGDEFALMCRRRSVADVAEFAGVVSRLAAEPVTVDDLAIVVPTSIGVAVINAADRDAVQPLRRADIAMYNAKWQRTGVEFYRDEIDRRTPARLSMLGDLRAAIQEQQLDVVYQPKLAIATGHVVGVEALVRWTHPTRGVVPPTDFVRVAEDTGLIKELTDLVLSRGIAQLADLRRTGITIGIAVNVSTHDLFDSRLPERVRGYLDEHDLPADALTLEITESSLFVDAPRTRATIDGLHALGMRLAIDDFGTGYSSLAYLRTMPVNELKIDGSFVSGMLTDVQDEVIVRSTTDLGHNLGLRVVAEGVESLAALQRLAEIGCDVAQGYAISPPLPADELVGWLRRAEAGFASVNP